MKITRSRLYRACALCAALAFVVVSRARAMSFVEGLSPEEKTASGVAKLSEGEKAALDRLVSRDVASAHEGGVTGFASSFSARHTAKEQEAAGLDQLSEKQRALLDVLAARAIALGPPPDEPFTFSPHAPAPPAASAPKSAPAQPNPVISALESIQLHGDVSFTVGGSTHGASFYGTALDLTATDPSGHFTLGFGYSELQGKGLFRAGYPYDAYPYGPFVEGPPYWGW